MLWDEALTQFCCFHVFIATFKPIFFIHTTNFLYTIFLFKKLWMYAEQVVSGLGLIESRKTVELKIILEDHLEFVPQHIVRQVGEGDGLLTGGKEVAED
jgi:hypothetical protein